MPLDQFFSFDMWIGWLMAYVLGIQLWDTKTKWVLVGSFYCQLLKWTGHNMIQIRELWHANLSAIEMNYSPLSGGGLY